MLSELCFICNKVACVLYGREEKIFKRFRLDVLMAMTMGITVFWYVISVSRQRAESLDGYNFEITFMPQSTLCNCCSSNRQNTQNKKKSLHNFLKKLDY
jgi:hypothetical protein